MGLIKSSPSPPTSKHACKTNGDCNPGACDPLHTAPQSKENYDWLVIIKVHKRSKGGRHCLFTCLHISSDTCHTAIWFFYSARSTHPTLSSHLKTHGWTRVYDPVYHHLLCTAQGHTGAAAPPRCLGMKAGSRPAHTSPVWNRANTQRQGQPSRTCRPPRLAGGLQGSPDQEPHAGEVGFSTEATSVLTVRRQRQPRHLTPHGSRGRVQTGSPTSDGVFVGAEEPWQQQQVEEVDQRQDVVAEQAGCRHRETCGHMNQMTTLSWMPSWLSGTLVFNLFFIDTHTIIIVPLISFHRSVRSRKNSELLYWKQSSGDLSPDSFSCPFYQVIRF